MDNGQETVQGTAAEVSTSMQSGNLLKPGGHHLLVYDTTDSLRKIFVEYAKAFLPENEIILFASQYCTPDDIKAQMENTGVDVEKHLSDGTLFIVDAQAGYMLTDAKGTFKLALSLLQRAKKEQRSGITWFGDLGSFFAFDKICELIDYELDCPAEYEHAMKTVCCYHRRDFARLDEAQKNTLIDHHPKSIMLV